MFNNLTIFGKVFLSATYFIMIVLCFYGGTFIDPFIGLAYFGFPVIIGIFISIFYIITSIENKKIHPFVFCVILLLLSSIIGNYYIKERANKLNEIGKLIENYYRENDIIILNIDELNKFKIKEDINIEIHEDIYFKIEYLNDNRFYYDSQYKRIFYKNIP